MTVCNLFPTSTSPLSVLKDKAPDEDDNDDCPRLREEGEGGDGRTLALLRNVTA